jgi:hypothetical protein
MARGNSECSFNRMTRIPGARGGGCSFCTERFYPLFLCHFSHKYPQKLHFKNISKVPRAYKRGWAAAKTAMRGIKRPPNLCNRCNLWLARSSEFKFNSCPPNLRFDYSPRIELNDQLFVDNRSNLFAGRNSHHFALELIFIDHEPIRHRLDLGQFKISSD